MAVTIRDVAQMAGVHVSTVSRTFSAPHLVNPETRTRGRRGGRGAGLPAEPGGQGPDDRPDLVGSSEVSAFAAADDALGNSFTEYVSYVDPNRHLHVMEFTAPWTA